MSTSIKVVESQSGDWTVVQINGDIDFEGHSVPVQYWIDLMRSYGFNIKRETVTDDQMLEGDY